MPEECKVAGADPMLKLHIPKPDHAWSRIGIDIVGPFSTVPHHEQFMVSVMDHYSGFPKVLLTMDICSSRIVSRLHMLFVCYGYLHE